MNSKIVWAAMAALLAIPGVAQTSQKTADNATAPWTPVKLADGQPDVQGFWVAEVGGTYSLVNPRRGGGRLREQQLEQQGKVPPKRTSRIVDPADGHIPYQPWARAKQQDIENNIDRPVKQEYIDPQARCLPDGVTRTIFWSGFQIQQYPGYVVMIFDQNHTYRVIPVDGRPHAPEAIKLWMSDSRGRWEGNTLVVDVTNSNAKHRLDNEGDFSSERVHITERFKFIDANTFEYESTFEDPSVYTRPWTLRAKMVRSHKNQPEWEQWEEACHEGERNADNALIDAKEEKSAGR
jgi:hypothetical protein